MSPTTDRLMSPDEPSSDPSTVRLKQDIEQTREDLSQTIAALEERLSPSQLRTALREEVQEVEQKVRVVLSEQMTEAKTLIQAEVREAKQALHTGMTQAEQMIRNGLRDAKETVKDELKDAVTAAKGSLRAVTLGKVENFATELGDTMNDARDSLVETIYNNPLPATLAGVGIAWLLMNRSRTASMRARGNGGDGGMEGYRRQQMGARVGETVGQMGAALGQATQQASSAVSQGLHGVTDTAGDMLEGASGMVSNLAQTAAEGFNQATSTVTESASALADRAQVGAKRVERAFEHQLHDRPLAIGAAAIALGTMVGCALPRTRAEDRLLGEARDSVLSNAKDAVHEVAASIGGGGPGAETEHGRQAEGHRGQRDRGASEQQHPQRGQEQQRSPGKQQAQGGQSAQGKQSDQQRSRKDADGKTVSKS